MSDADAAEKHGQPAAPARISFRDHFAGTTESLSHINIPLLPDEQAALVQVTRPLQLTAAAHESCSVVRWAAMASSRPPAPPAAAAAAPRLRARRLSCACASARHVRLGGDGMQAAGLRAWQCAGE